MKNRFIQLFLVICAVMLMICAVSVYATAEEATATPTDLMPVETAESEPETTEPETTEPEVTETEAAGSETTDPQATEPENADLEETVDEETADSVEIIITKAVRIGDSWSGTMKKTKPAVLKLDVDRAQEVNLLVQGRHVWITVEKSDRLTDNPARTLTDGDSSQAVISWFAEAGSYLITLGPVEPNLMAKANVTIMDDADYGDWKSAQEAQEEYPEEDEKEPADTEETVDGPEEESKKTDETADEPTEESAETEYTDCPESEIKENLDNNTEAEDPETVETTETESEEIKEEASQNRSIEISVTCDSPNPVVGDTAHFEAKLYGYEELTYTIQWQYSPDHKNWFDIPDATETYMDVVTDDENNLFYWRVLVYIEEDTAE